MRKDAPFAIGETYHIYNRGAHKQDIFTCERDYQRFLLSLYLANTDKPVNIRETLRKYKGQTFGKAFEEPRGTLLVNVRAYCLMPNHFHLILQQRAKQGITIFLRKLLTGYSMYFNTLYEHSGILSQGAVKSRHVSDEAYFRYLFAYVHLNPLSLHFPEWEVGGISDHDAARKFLREHRYSSFYDYSIGPRPERAALAFDEAPDFLQTQNDLEELLESFKGQTFGDVRIKP